MSARILIRSLPLLVVLFFIFYFEWQAWTANSRRQQILSAPKGSLCDPKDLVCKQCPFFRETVKNMSVCVEEILEKRLKKDDAGYIVNSIPFAITTCNLNWTMSQRIVQMIKERDTQLVLAPSSPRAPMTAIVVGSDNDFEMEKQLAENMTRVHFYGVNLHSMESVAHFKRRLNGTILHKHLHTAEENEKEDSTKLVPARFFDKYFPRRPVDVVFLHLNHTSQNFIDQLMGNGEHGLKFPVCQLNIDIELPTRIGEARRMVRWFKRLSTETKALHKQYIVGYSTIVMNGSSMRLRFYAINVGQPKCVAKFLDQSECRALIGSIYDE